MRLLPLDPETLDGERYVSEEEMERQAREQFGEPIQKHLEGEHDQKLHGRRGDAAPRRGRVPKDERPDFHREEWKVGDGANFEYHCFESDESCDAELWHRSHELVTVIEAKGADGDWENSTFDERMDYAAVRIYRVRFFDGFEYDAFEDELLTNVEGFTRPDPPDRSFAKHLEGEHNQKLHGRRGAGATPEGDDDWNERSGDYMVDLYHGTTNRALERIKEEGFVPQNPRATVDMVADHFGLDREEFWKHPMHDFSRGRQQEWEQQGGGTYFGTDPNSARIYASAHGEVLYDAMSAAYFALHPEAERYKGTSEHQSWISNELADWGIKPTFVHIRMPMRKLIELGEMEVYLPPDVDYRDQFDAEGHPRSTGARSDTLRPMTHDEAVFVWERDIARAKKFGQNMHRTIIARKRIPPNTIVGTYVAKEHAFWSDVFKHITPGHGPDDQKKHGKKGGGTYVEQTPSGIGIVRQKTQGKLFDPTTYTDPGAVAEQEAERQAAERGYPEDFDVSAAVMSLADLEEGSEEYSVVETQIAKYLGDVVTHEFPHGFKTHPNGVRVYSDGTVEIAGGITDASGEGVGSFVRVLDFSNGMVRNDYFKLDDHVQGKNFATEFNGYLFERYREMGFTEVQVHADIDVGGYAWAKEGFSFADFGDIPDRIGGVLEVEEGEWGYEEDEPAEPPEWNPQSWVGTYADTVDEAITLRTWLQSIYEDMRNGYYEGEPIDIAMLGYKESKGKGKGAMWLGKEIMLGSDWTGVFHL